MKLWQFVEARDGGAAVWTWRIVGPSGDGESISQPHRNFGAAVADAIKHGFQPSNDRWNVVTQAGTTRFEPSETPAKGAGLDGTQPLRPATDGKGTGI